MGKGRLDYDGIRDLQKNLNALKDLSLNMVERKLVEDIEAYCNDRLVDRIDRITCYEISIIASEVLKDPQLVIQAFKYRFVGER